MNVIVLEAPGLHLGYLGCYGNDWIDTPAVDRLASKAVVFDRHLADCPQTAAGAWTGRARFPWLKNTEESSECELESLMRNGSIEFVRLLAVENTGRDYSVRLDETLKGVRSALVRIRADRPALLWVELPSLSPPWFPDNIALERFFPAEESEDPEEAESEGDGDFLPISSPPADIGGCDGELRERIQFTYAAVVECFDRGLANILGCIQEQSWWPDSVLALTSPQGIALGEHGAVGDENVLLHEELMHLPLIVRLPGDVQAGRRVAAMTQPVDLFPTILQWFGQRPDRSDGHSLQPLLHGLGDWPREYALTGWESSGISQWALSTAEWAFFLATASEAEPPLTLPSPPGGEGLGEDLPFPPGEEGLARGLYPRLYHKPDDRWEVNDVRQQNIATAELLEGFLRELIDGMGTGEDFMFPPLPNLDDE